MCSKQSDNIITFNVSGTKFQITISNLAKHPESWLTAMVNESVQPSDGFFVECCPVIFEYILGFILDDTKIDPELVAKNIGITESTVRTIIDQFKLKSVYTKNNIKIDQVNLAHTCIPEITVRELKNFNCEHGKSYECSECIVVAHIKYLLDVQNATRGRVNRIKMATKLFKVLAEPYSEFLVADYEKFRSVVKNKVSEIELDIRQDVENHPNEVAALRDVMNEIVKLCDKYTRYAAPDTFLLC